MSEKPYSVSDIIISKLKRLGCDGLASPDAECGCGIDDLAPCGGTCMDCLPARSRVTSEGIGWFAVGFVKRPHEAKESNSDMDGTGHTRIDSAGRSGMGGEGQA